MYRSRSSRLANRQVLFFPNDFYKLAIWLCGTTSQNSSNGQRTDEAALRTAISRTYYAAHLAAREALVRKRWTPSGTGQDHGGVIKELRSRQKLKMSGELSILHRLRGHADYHIDNNAGYSKRSCPYCVQHQRSAGGNVVTVRQWHEAFTIASSLIPQLLVY